MQLSEQLSDYQLLRKDINSYVFTVANIHIITCMCGYQTGFGLDI
jgi:hypothetical protein